jgi:acetoacetyl-CoA synthetase
VVTPLWAPSGADVEASALDRFRREVGATDYEALHRWSIAEPEAFWRRLAAFSEVVGSLGDAPSQLDRMPGAVWFPQASLSFAENLLVRRDAAPALIERDESGARTETSFAALAGRVAVLAEHLRTRGVGAGDRVAAILPNRSEAVIAMLAATSMGAVWSACSPDFGTEAIVDRFGQIAPHTLIACTGYTYAGRYFDCRQRLADVVDRIGSIAHVIVVGDAPIDTLRIATLRFADVSCGPVAAPHFRRGAFADPLYILFSSGTTGAPKCIVHGQGGTLLKHRAEHALHCDLRRDERVLFFTTCGWMMWNWLVSALANGTSICLYDGSPFHDDAGALFRVVEEERIDHLGISPGFLSALAKEGYQPRARHRLAGLRSILSTGSPLPADAFHFAHEHIAPVRLSSITGGTDIIGCFALGNPCLPVWPGEIQSVALGLDVAFLDDEGRRLPRGKGELACMNAFPSMPVGFWSDPDGRRLRAAYFERYPGAWHHGDFGEFTPHGGLIIHGRSDAVLNRGGVRIGTAEIYRPLETIPEVQEAIAVAHERGADVEIWLFVRLRAGAELDQELAARIRSTIRAGASPRHTPDRIEVVTDIPRTRSGKLSELAVREVVHGRRVRNVGALANPEALELFRVFADPASGPAR